MCTWLLARVERLRPKVDHPRPSNAEVQNRWSNTPTPSTCLNTWDRAILAPLRLFSSYFHLNPLKAQLNPICHLLPLLGTHHILHVGRIRVKQHYILFFTVVPCTLLLSKFFINKWCKREVFKAVLQFTLKLQQLQHVSVWSPSSGSVLCELAKDSVTTFG